MNHVYRLISKDALHTLQLQVDSSSVYPREGTTSKIGCSPPRKRPLALTWAATLALGVFALPAWAVPTCPVGTTLLGSAIGTPGTIGNGSAGQTLAGSGNYCLPAPGIIVGGAGSNGGGGGNGGTGSGGGIGGGNGGAGVSLSGGATLINIGGNGSAAGSFTGFGSGGGNGGTGSGGGSGGIGGGNGGAGGFGGAAGAGGAGLEATGNSHVTNVGIIVGGLSGNGTTQADSVNFSGGGNVLTLEVGSAEAGNIVSTSGSTNGGDTLILGDDTLAGGPGPGGSDSLNLGTVSGFDQLEKTGTSTWAATGNASFAGSITVAGGTLQVGDGTLTALSGSSTTVQNGATLDGFGAVGAPTTIAAGATLIPGSGVGNPGVFLINGPLDMLGTLAIGIDGVGAFGSLGVTGAVSFGTSSLLNFALGNDTNQHAGDTFRFFNASSFLDFADAQHNFSCSGLRYGLNCGLSDRGNNLVLTLNTRVARAPEPSSLSMLGLGLLLISGCMRWWGASGGKRCSRGNYRRRLNSENSNNKLN